MSYEKDLIQSTTYTGKANTIRDINDLSLDPTTPVSLDVDVVKSATVTGGRDKILDTDATMGESKLSADALTVQDSTFTGGADSIALGALKGTDAVKQAILIGDAESITSSVVRAGNDTISIAKDVEYASIYSDVQSVDTSRFTAGNDNIVISGNVKNSAIFSDAQSIGPNNLSASGGRDIINLKGTTQTSTINAGLDNDRVTLLTSLNNTIDGGIGNDTITITNATGNLNDQGILGNDGNDSISITQSLLGHAGDDTAFAADNTLRKNVLDGGAGNDIIKLNIVDSGAVVNGGLDNDKISAKEVSLSDIHGNDGNDSFTITNLNSGSINGDEGNDTLVITTMHGGTAKGNEGDDSIKIAKLNIAEVQGNDGDDVITITTMGDKSLTGRGVVYGNDGNDTITITTMNLDSTGSGGTIYGDNFDSSLPGGDDSIKVTTFDGSIFAGNGNDTITITTSHGYIIGEGGDDSINISKLYDGSEVYGDQGISGLSGNDTIIVTNMYGGRLGGSHGNDSISIGTMHGGSVYEVYTSALHPNGNDTLIINKYTAGTIDLRDGNDYLKITSKYKSTVDDDTFVTALGTGNDTLEVGWAFNGIFDNTNATPDDLSDDISRTLITKGLGTSTELKFGAGDDGLIINGSLSRSETLNMGKGDDTLSISGTLSKSNPSVVKAVDMGAGNDYLKVTKKAASITDDDLVTALGTGHDTLEIGWAFNGTFDNTNGTSTPSDDSSRTLITKGLGTSAKLLFEAGDDGFVSTAALAGQGKSWATLFMGAGDDTVSLTSATDMQIWAGTGNDLITSSATLTRTQVDTGEGTDTVSIALGAGSKLDYSTDGFDDITIKGTYNNGFAFADGGAEAGGFDGLSTGSDGGAITIDTWGTGQLEFGTGADTLTINKAFTGSKGSKDINTGHGSDLVNLMGTVNGSTVNVGEGNDTVYLYNLGSTGIVDGGAGDDVIQVQRNYTATANAKKVASVLSNGKIYGGDGHDNIIIGNSYADGTLLGTMSGGMIDAGTGNDSIVADKVSSKAQILAGDDDDLITINAMSGGSVFGNAGADTINIATMSGGIIYIADTNDNINIGNMSGGSTRFENSNSTLNLNVSGTVSGKAIINGDLNNDFININTMKAGTINASAGNDVININTLMGGTVNGGDGINIHTIDSDMQGGSLIGGINTDNYTIYGSMNNGTINGGNGSNIVHISNNMLKGTIIGGNNVDVVTIMGEMSSGSIKSGLSSDNILISSLKGGTISSGEDNDFINISTSMTGGTINTENGNDTITLQNMHGGKVNAGNGDDNIVAIKMTGGSINAGEGNNVITMQEGYKVSVTAGKGNDTLILDDPNYVSALSYNLGAGQNVIILKDSNDDNLEHKNIILNSSHDSVNIESMQFSSSNLNTGSGNDLIVQDFIPGLYHFRPDSGAPKDIAEASKLVLKTYREVDNSTIDAGSGNDTLVLGHVKNASTILSGSGNDSLNIYQVDTSIINAGDGHNYIKLQHVTNSHIITGSGNDSIVFDASYDSREGPDGPNDTTLKGEVDAPSIISMGTGSDYLDISTAKYAPDLPYTYASDYGEDPIDDSIPFDPANVFIEFDNKGLDTLMMPIYQYGMIKDTKGQVVNLGTGTDGGTIVIDTWTSGEITFGNGRDVLEVGIIEPGNASFKGMKNGNDYLKINENKSSITDTELANLGSGNDTLDIGWVFNGTFNAGNDGGTLITTGLGNGAQLTFGKGADALIIDGDRNSIRDNYLGDLADTALVDLLGAGRDTLSIGWDFNGEFHTANTGGTLMATGLHEDANLSFGNGNDGLIIDADLSHNLNFGKGVDTISLSGFQGGSITYDTAGFDSISIFATYDGRGVNDYSGGLSTGADGGYIHVDGLSAHGSDNLHFSQKADYFSFYRLDDESSFVDLGAGNDTVASWNPVWYYGYSGQYSNILEGTIDTGDGHDSVNISYNRGVIYGGAGNDTLTAYDNDGSIYGEEGNDVIYALYRQFGFISGGAGNDSIFVNEMISDQTILGGDGDDLISIMSMYAVDDSLIDAGNGNDTIELMVEQFPTWYEYTAVSLSTGGPYVNGGDLTDDDSEDVDIYGGAGDDLFINHIEYIRLPGWDERYASLYGGEGNDTFNFVDGSSLNIDGGAGDDVFNFETIIYTGGTRYFPINMVLNGGEGNDIFNVGTYEITTHNSVGYNAGDGDDTINIANHQGGTIYAGDGNDFVTIDRMSSTLHTEAGNDTALINYMNTGSSLNMRYGDDYLHVKNMVSGTVSTEDQRDTIIIDTMSGGGIYAGHHEDNISINLMQGGSVDAEGYDDYVNVFTLEDGEVKGNDGADTIIVNTMRGGSVNGNNDNDLININNMFDGTVSGGAHDDTFNIDNMHGGTVQDDGGNNALNINIMNDGSLLCGEGNDNIKITSLLGGSINAGAGNDTVLLNALNTNITLELGLGDDSLSLLNKSAYTDTNLALLVAGQDGHDTLDIRWAFDGIWDTSADTDGSTLSTIGIGEDAKFIFDGMDNELIIHGSVQAESDITMGNNNDTLTIEGSLASDVNLGAGNNSFTLMSNLNQRVQSGDGNDLFNIMGDLNTTIENGHGNDTINVTGNVNADLTMGNNNDVVNIAGALSTSVDMGAGDDSLTIDGILHGTVFMGDGDDYLKLNYKPAGLSDEDLLNSLGNGNDTLDINWDFNGHFDFSSGKVILSTGFGKDATFVFNDLGNKITVNDSLQTGDDLNFGAGNDTLSIAKDLYRNAYMNGGNDSLTIAGNLNANVDLGDGDDFSSITGSINGDVIMGDGDDFASITGEISGDVIMGDGDDTLILGGGDINANIDLGLGSNHLKALAKPSNISDTELANYLGAGKDTLEVNWYFSGTWDATSGHDNVLIANGISSTANLLYGEHDDTLILHRLDRDVNLGTGNDHITVNEITHTGNIIYDTVGLDSVYITGTYNGNGAAGSLHTGSDGGFIHINNISSEGFQALEFGEGEDTLTILNVTGSGIIETLGGNDSIIIGSDQDADSGMSAGLINSGDGNDIFTISSLSGGTVESDTGNDTINATSVSGGQIDGQDGHDSITVSSLSRGTIYGGDGNDIITVTTSISWAYIYGGEGNDTLTIPSGRHVIRLEGGDDSLAVDSLSGLLDLEFGDGHDIARIKDYAGYNIFSMGNGNDSIYIDTVQQGSHIRSDAGDDFFDIETVNGGWIQSGTGNDVFDVESLNGEIESEDGNNNFIINSLMSQGSIVSGDGDDTFIINNLEGSVESGAGDDSFTIFNSEGTLRSGDGNNHITINILLNGLDAGNGNDTITITEFNAISYAKIIETMDGDDSISITSMDGGSVSAGRGTDTISIITLNDGFVYGREDNDTITIGTMIQGSVSGNEGNDTIGITTMNDGSVSGNEGNDTIGITTMHDGDVYGNIGDDKITVTTMNDGAIYAEEGNDTITIGTMTQSWIEGGEGNDNITISDMSSSNVYGGEGQDSITVSNMTSGYINAGWGDDTISVEITHSATPNVTLFGDYGNDEFIIDGAGFINIRDFNAIFDTLVVDGVERTIAQGQTEQTWGLITVYFT